MAMITWGSISGATTSAATSRVQRIPLRPTASAVSVPRTTERSATGSAIATLFQSATNQRGVFQTSAYHRVAQPVGGKVRYIWLVNDITATTATGRTRKAKNTSTKNDPQSRTATASARSSEEAGVIAAPVRW